MSSEISSMSNSLDLINYFGTNFNISNPIENDTIRQHPKFYNYGSKIDVVKNVQNKRRLEFLQNLKRKREAIIEKMRRLIEVDIFEDDVILENNKIDCTNDKAVLQNKNDDTSMEIDYVTSIRSNTNSKKLSAKNDFRKLISDKFMLSEWLVDIPEDFFEKWYMLCCPKGRRTLVVASNGRTRVYTRTGYFLFQFQSLIPGGCRRSPSKHNVTSKKNSILDCIFVETEQTFYILDVIVWNGCSFYDCDTEFRFYWMHNNIGEELNQAYIGENILANDAKMSETVVTCGDSNNQSNDNPQSSMFCKRYFKPLQYWSCSMDNIRLRANGPYPFKTNIDGILFYHKEAPYTAGITPLVCWLKVHMIPKIFNISFE